MITETILNIFQSAVTFLLGLLPNIPQMSDTIKDSTETIIDLIGDVVGVISYLYTPTILVLVFTLLVAVLSFDAIYKFILWVLHKIRG
jgi:hypothetical protein